MDAHVKVLAVLEIAMSACGLFGAFVLMLIFGGAIGVLGARGDADAAFAMPIIGLTGMALVGFLVLLSVPGLVIGIGLLKRRPWARVAGIVICILGMMAIPFGTALGIYGLWVLFSKETEQLFQASA
ncbi:MAG TPA: hypothetical protein VFA27_11365 [Vicinamibacterales bacterium]|nr:hypothetical protein [Vicinamibacterales bacterium]